MNSPTWRPLPYLAHQDVVIFHAYKDEYSDVPLENWYSTTDSAMPGSSFEFDVRDLRRFMRNRILVKTLSDAAVVRAAIDANILQAHVAPRV